MDLTIVVPHYGDPAPAQALVAQLLRQRNELATEIVVVDDHSPITFPDTDGVHIIRRPVNGGFGAAVNSALSTAAGDLFLVLNSDLLVDSTFLADLVAAAGPWMPAVVSPRVLDVDGHETWTGRHFPRIRHYVVEWLVPLARWRECARLHEAVGRDTRARGLDTQAVDWVSGAVLLAPTATLRSVGGFDERFHMYCEEVDLQRRLRDRGVPSLVIGRVAATHLGGASTPDEKKLTWLVSARLKYADKWRGEGFPCGRRSVQLPLTAATGANLVWNTLRRLMGREVHPLRRTRIELRAIWPHAPGADVIDRATVRA